MVTVRPINTTSMAVPVTGNKKTAKAASYVLCGSLLVLLEPALGGESGMSSGTSLCPTLRVPAAVRFVPEKSVEPLGLSSRLSPP
jgi:hypothetical protein